MKRLPLSPTVKYTVIKSEDGKICCIEKGDSTNESKLWIPPDESNNDYLDYLEWKEAGNTPLESTI